MSAPGAPAVPPPAGPPPGFTATATENAPRQTVLHPVEGPTRLSDSILFKSQRSFYVEKNVQAWSGADTTVPHFVSSNAYLANCYASLILAYARDLHKAGENGGPSLDRRPINIVEIGAGHGKLGFLVAVKLMKLRSFWPWEMCFRFVLTDIVQETVDYWACNPRLERFLLSGYMDYAVFDAENDTEIHLQRSGEVLNAKYFRESHDLPGGQAPVVFIANYVFDTLKQDAFRIERGELQETFAAVFSEEEEDEAQKGGWAMIPRVKVKWSSRKCDSDYYHGADAEFNRILDTYLQHHNEASFVVPIGGLRCLRNMKNMLQGAPVLWLLGDKGYAQQSQIGGVRDPHVAVHGSFSFMVNMHACKLYVENTLKGCSMLTPKLEGFKCAALVVGSKHADVRGLRFQWHNTMHEFNPEDFTALQRCVRDEAPHPSLKTALTTTRLAHWDTDVFLKFKRIIIDKTPHATDRMKADVYRDMLQVWDCYYPLDKTKDIAFEIGRIMMGLRKYGEAAEYFQQSNIHCGEHHVTWYNVGICMSYVEEYEKSLAGFDKSLAMKPTYADAIKWRKKVRAIQEQQQRNPEGGGAVDQSDVSVQVQTNDAGCECCENTARAPKATHPQGVLVV